MFFFYFSRKNPAPPHGIDPQGIVRKLMPMSPPDKSGFLADGDESVMVQCIHWNTARSRLEPAPLYHAPGRIAAASWARLDNRDELGKELGIDPPVLARYCDTELILFSYLKWGEACVEHLTGDFVFVIHDRERRTVFCGRDHMGARPFYYFASDDVFVCATTLAAFPRLECVPLRIDQQWVAEYLVQLSMSFDRTPYEGMKKLPPAHCLTVTPARMQLRRYFQLSAEPALKLRDSREYVDAYREQLEKAVACRLDSEYAIGSELSGGLDSSSVTAYAAKLLDQPASRLHAFSFAIFEMEPKSILTVSRVCGIANNHIFAGRVTDPRDLAHHSLLLLGYPAEHPNAATHEPFYGLAEKLEIRTLLSGFGGDEFGATIRGHMALKELLMERRFRNLFDILPGNALFRILRLLKMEMKRRKTCNFAVPAYNPRFYEAFTQRWLHHVVRDELVRQYDLEARFLDKARFDAGYTDLKRFTLEQFWQPRVPARMENCALMAAGRKLEYRWPLLDVRLVRLFLSIPSEENYYRGMGRYLHRRAVDGIVPGTVAWQRSKDMGRRIGPPPGATPSPPEPPIFDLPPALSVCVDVEKVNRQIEAGRREGYAHMPENKRIQYARNLRALTDMGEWMAHVEADAPESLDLASSRRQPCRDMHTSLDNHNLRAASDGGSW